MPTCRRKRVLLTEPSNFLLSSLSLDQNKEVYYLAQTGEIFETYEAYASRMSFYRMKHFQCEVTGKSGLDYFQALDSEQQEARTMHSRFPEPLKAAVLKAVQWQVMGRLDHLVEAVYDRFRDRYYPDEKIIVDVQGDKYFARVVQVFPPRPVQVSSPEAHASTSASPLSSDDEPIHKIAEDLRTPIKDSVARDDPTRYYYKVQILEEERQPGATKHSATKTGKQNKFSGSLMDVQCPDMGRDRLAFSKSILRRFIRDCVDRDAAVASPWVVKPLIAVRYGVNSVMPEEIRQGVENLKKGESDKRKKVWEDREGPTKRQKKAAADEEKAKALAERRKREAREKEEKAQKAKEESERLAAEKKKKKPTRYPTEDLDVTIGDKEKKAGMKLAKPPPSRTAMPFGLDNATNDMFLMSWTFLVVYGQPLHISTFTMDDYEAALRHSVSEPACPLLAEVHSTLIYNLRTVPFNRHAATLSLTSRENNPNIDTPCLGVSTETLAAAMADIGNNWERAPLRYAEGREGWEESLIGCLKDHATLENFPRLREILTRLLFAPEPHGLSVASSSSSTSPAPSPSPAPLKVSAPPRERYLTLSPVDRVAILSFMCNLAVSSKAIHTHMESCEEQLTALRKEKIEVNRTKKQLLEEMAVLTGENKEASRRNGGDEDVAMHDSSELSDAPPSDVDMDTPGGTPTRNPKETRRKTQAKERELARAKQASAKQALAEHRRLDEEVNKLERRLEAIEREFRKLLGAVRVKPLGRDRFYNRIWWFDGMGAASLIGSGGTVQYGSGRLFVQGPSEHDVDLLTRRDEDIKARRLEEEGEGGMLAVGEWAVYDELEVADEFVAWLNPKGVRELSLKNTLAKWWPHIGPGMRRRAADQAATAKLPEARRSARMKHPGSDISREPYMLWTNRRAVNSS